jgi:hypothetical protein
MATATQGLVLDLLVAKLQGLTYTLEYGTDTTVYVIDGIPAKNLPANMVTITGLPDDDTRGTEDWAEIGKARNENYDIAIHIRSYVGGNSSPTAGLSQAQAYARANASAIEATIEAAILADANLMAANGGLVAPITWILVSNVSYRQTSIEDDDGKGRYATYDLIAHVYNRLGPS